MIHAVKIDVIARTVESLEFECNLDNLYREMNCKTVAGYKLDGHHFMYIDDEGRFNVKGYFILPSFSQPIANNAVVVGTADREGEDTSALRELTSVIRQTITFFPPEA
jgi:hypothetical protein